MEQQLRQLIGDLVMQIAALRAQVEGLTKQPEQLKVEEAEPAHPGQ